MHVRDSWGLDLMGIESLTASMPRNQSIAIVAGIKIMVWGSRSWAGPCSPTFLLRKMHDRSEGNADTSRFIT